MCVCVCVVLLLSWVVPLWSRDRHRKVFALLNVCIHSMFLKKVLILATVCTLQPLKVGPSHRTLANIIFIKRY